MNQRMDQWTKRTSLYGGRIVFQRVGGGGDGGGGGEGEAGGNDANGGSQKEDGGGGGGGEGGDEEAVDFDTIDFTGMDLDNSCPRLKVSDRITFDVAADRITGERRAVSINILAPSPKPPPPPAAAGAAAKGSGEAAAGAGSAGDGGEATAGGATTTTAGDGRELGRIEKLTASYGFIRKLPVAAETSSPSSYRDHRGGDAGGASQQQQQGGGGGGGRPVSLFFHYTNLTGGCREEDLTVGAAVWFGRGEDGRSVRDVRSVGHTRVSVRFHPHRTYDHVLTRLLTRLHSP